MENKKKVILDCDPGHDDAFGIMLAVQHLDVLGITTIGGNCTLENVTRNAIKVLEVLGVADRIGVYPGHSCPMVAPLVTAPQFHGETGLDGPVLPEPTHAAQNKHAVDFIVDTVMSTDDVTLIATGPLTNIALLLKTFPEVKSRIERIVLMGGSVTRGNKGVMAEFNIFVDPEAAKIVLTSGLDITMATLDAGLGTVIPPEKTAQLKDMGKVGLMAHDLFQRYRKRSFGTGLKMYDACAVACLLEPDLFDMTKAFVDVEIAGELTAGCTVVDLKGYLKREPNATVTTGVHADRFCDWFMDGIAHCA